MSSSQAPMTLAGELYEKWSKEYDRLAGDTTHNIARFMLSTPPAPETDAVVLDNACGTGAVTFELLKLFPAPGPRPKIHAADVAPGMIELLNEKAREEKVPNGVIETAVMDAQNLGFSNDSFSIAYMNFAIYFLPDADGGAAELYRTLRPGGTAFVSSWEQLGYLPVVNAAHKSVRPHDDPFLKSLGLSEEWFTEKKLKDTLAAGGFAAEKIKILRAKTASKSDSLDGLIGGILYPFSKAMEAWSEVERGQMRDAMKANLTDEQKRTISFEMGALIAVAEK